MESIDPNTKLFNLSENKIFYSLEILLLKKLPVIDPGKQQNVWNRQFNIRSISLENFIYYAQVESQEDQIEELHPIGCRCHANQNNDHQLQRKYIRFFVIIKDLEKDEDDEDSSECTQIFVPMEWKNCEKCIAFVEFIGRQIFGPIYKCITMCCKMPRSADINSGIDILTFLNELFEHINNATKLVNNNSEDGEENEFGCNAESLGIDLSNCNQNAAQELELLGNLLAKKYVTNLDKWPIVNNGKFRFSYGIGNEMKKHLRIAYSSMEPPELLSEACFKAPIKFKTFCFIYCSGNLTKFVEKLIEYFLYEKAETIMPESVNIELFDQETLADWPPPCLAIYDEQLAETADDIERKNQILRKEGITLAVKCERLYSITPNAKFILRNESIKKEFFMNIWFRSKDWTINPQAIRIYQTNLSGYLD